LCCYINQHLQGNT
jgi:hypothetical protein